MQDVKVKPMPDLYRHPHSVEVRRHMSDLVKTVAGQCVQGEVFLQDGMVTARNAPLKLQVLGLGNLEEKRTNKLIVPLRVKSTVVMHAPPYDEPESNRTFSSADSVMDRLDEFYFRHIDEHYLQRDMRPMLGFREMMGKVFKAVNRLDPICLFQVRSLRNATLNGLPAGEREKLLQNDIVLVRAILKDEYQCYQEYDYDYKSDIQIISPSAALAIAAQRTPKQGIS